MSQELFAYKWLVGEPIKAPDGLVYRDLMAVVVAPDEEKALARLEAYCETFNLDSSWLKLVEPEEIPINMPVVLAWVGV